jgi:predicted outer membrane protein
MMSRRFVRRRFCGALAAIAVLLAIVGLVLAQTDSGVQPYPAGAGDATGNVPAQSGSDQFLASWLLADSHGELALARLAEDRASNRDVKSLARTFVDDHARFIHRLQQWGGDKSSPPAAVTPKLTVFPSPRTSRPDTVATTAGASAGTPAADSDRAAAAAQIDPVLFKTEILQRIGAMAERTVSQQRGFDVDRSFLNDQEPRQVQMLATLEVAREHASPPLRQVIDESIAATRRHLDEIHNAQARLGFPNAWRGMTPLDGSGTRR